MSTTVGSLEVGLSVCEDSWDVRRQEYWSHRLRMLTDADGPTSSRGVGGSAKGKAALRKKGQEMQMTTPTTLTKLIAMVLLALDDESESFMG